MTTILGLNNMGHDTSAAIIRDGEIIAAITEERLNRKKKSNDFPIMSIKKCLEICNLKFEDIDVVTTGWNPVIHLKRLFPKMSNSNRFRPEYLYSVPNFLMQLHSNNEPSNNTFTELKLLDKNPIDIKYITHHLAHAASSFYLSGYKKSAILSIDGFGEQETTLYATGENNKIMPLKSILFPYSLGIFYRAFTDYLGFIINMDEWKVMGAGSYGDPSVYYDKIRKLVSYDDDGNFEMDLSYFDYYTFDRPADYSTKMETLLGKARKKDEPITQKHYDIAATVQKVTEEVLINMLNYLYKVTKCENLVIAGGVAMNTLAMGKILKNTPFKNLYISPFPDDNGVNIGSALYYYHNILDNPAKGQLGSNYFGSEYSDDFIKSELDKSKLKYKYLEQPEDVAARYISDGKIIGWFQGRMEFGQRALGNRSILADPRDPNMKDKINKAIKFREEFRPFASSIIIEHYKDYFVDASPTPFMEKIFDVKEEKRKIIPAVTHIDGTGRIQTVSKEQNLLYWKLINKFYELTKVPLVLNTSFNLKGEPIVCTPNDAIRTFHSCGLDALFIGKFLVEK